MRSPGRERPGQGSCLLQSAAARAALLSWPGCRPGRPPPQAWVGWQGVPCLFRAWPQASLPLHTHQQRTCAFLPPRAWARCRSGSRRQQRRRTRSACSAPGPRRGWQQGWVGGGAGSRLSRACRRMPDPAARRCSSVAQCQRALPCAMQCQEVQQLRHVFPVRHASGPCHVPCNAMWPRSSGTSNAAVPAPP